MNYSGSCHCGQISFDVEGELTGVMSCNCSMCQRKGTLMWFVPRARFQLKTPDANASTYKFNKHHIAHRFCPVCGIHPYGEGTDAKGNAMVSINIRTLENVEIETIPVQHYNGRAA